MMPQIKHILYATDLSDGARTAMEYAVALANAMEASLTVIHVIKQTAPNAELLIQAFLGYSSKEEVKQKSRAQITEEIKKRLWQMCDQLGGQLPECRFCLADVIVEFGRPQDLILKHAETGKYDCLVMNHHDYGLAESTIAKLSGKTLINQCPIPVLLVPVPHGTETIKEI